MLFCCSLQWVFKNSAPFQKKQYCFGWIAVLLSGQSGTALIRWFQFLPSCCRGISRMINNQRKDANFYVKQGGRMLGGCLRAVFLLGMENKAGRKPVASCLFGMGKSTSAVLRQGRDGRTDEVGVVHLGDVHFYLRVSEVG